MSRHWPKTAAHTRGQNTVADFFAGMRSTSPACARSPSILGGARTSRLRVSTTVAPPRGFLSVCMGGARNTSPKPLFTPSLQTLAYRPTGGGGRMSPQKVIRRACYRSPPIVLLLNVAFCDPVLQLASKRPSSPGAGLGSRQSSARHRLVNRTKWRQSDVVPKRVVEESLVYPSKNSLSRTHQNRSQIDGMWSFS